MAKSKTKTPLSYYGSKVMLAPHLIAMMPPHVTYAEVFGGGGAVLFAKPPSLVEVYNDVDGDLVNFFRVLRGSDGDRLIRQLELTPHSRAEHACCKRDFRGIVDPIERARCFFILVKQSYGCLFMDSYSSGSAKGISQVWRNKVDQLPEAVNRLRAVQIENLDFETLIRKFDKKDTLFYCDPPYVLSTRTANASRPGGKYKHEMSDVEHERLLNVLTSVKGKVMLSGYHNALYDGRLKGWRTWTKSSRVVSATANNVSGIERTEVVWFNF